MLADVAAIDVALTLQRSRHSRVVAVALNGIGEITDALQLRGNSLPARGSRDGDAIRAQIALIDALLTRVRRTLPGATLVVVSPCAVAPPPLPVSVAAVVQIAGDVNDPGRNDGFVMLAGDGFVHRANPAAAEVVDVVPSILYAAALPVARDLDGEVITDAFDDRTLHSTPLSMIQSYSAPRLVVR
jgi:hypothetical protein